MLTSLTIPNVPSFLISTRQSPTIKAVLLRAVRMVLAVDSDRASNYSHG
jgi:hypothetical protein